MYPLMMWVFKVAMQLGPHLLRNALCVSCQLDELTAAPLCASTRSHSVLYTV